MILKTAFAYLSLLFAILIAPFAHATESPATPTAPTIEAPKVEKPTAPKPNPLFNPAGDLRRLQGGVVKPPPETTADEDENIGPEDLLEQPKLADSNDPAETTLESGTASFEEIAKDPAEDPFFYDLLND